MREEMRRYRPLGRPAGLASPGAAAMACACLERSGPQMLLPAGCRPCDRQLARPPAGLARSAATAIATHPAPTRTQHTQAAPPFCAFACAPQPRLSCCADDGAAHLVQVAGLL